MTRFPFLLRSAFRLCYNAAAPTAAERQHLSEISPFSKAVNGNPKDAFLISLVEPPRFLAVLSMTATGCWEATGLGIPDNKESHQFL